MTSDLRVNSDTTFLSAVMCAKGNDVQLDIDFIPVEGKIGEERL